MEPRKRYLWLVFLAASQAGLAQERDAPRVPPLRGRVVNAADNVPLRRARVTLSDGDRPLEVVMTDDEGRFAIANAPAASPTVRVVKAGYAGAVLPLTAEREDTDLRFALTRSAAVTGRVLDQYGAPVPNASVTARGKGQFVTRTDALGEYRLGGLPPDRYTIMAGRDVSFGPGAALDPARGTHTVTVAAGDEIDGVDFTMAGAAETCPSGTSVIPADGARTATIRGRVTGTGGEPLACARVSIVDSDISMPSVFTDPQGRFVMEGLPARAVIVEARKLGYIALQYGQQRPSDAETVIRLRQQELRSRVDIVLPRGSIISGTVVDEYGEPVEGIPIMAIQLGRLESWTTVKSTAFPRPTDDRGRYRLTGLDPGTYVVASTTKSGVSSDGTGEARGYTTSFYPGTSDVLTAQRIVLEAGRDAEGVDIPLTATRMATVAGSLFDAAGMPFKGTVSLAASVRSGAIPVDSWGASVDSRGRFEIRNVPPGDYVLKGFDAPFDARQFTMQYVSVADASPAPVTMTMSAGATVEGSVIVEGATSPDGRGIIVAAQPTHPDYTSSGVISLLASAGMTSGSTLDGGRFRLVRMRGPSRLHVTTPSCESCYLKSAFVNGADAVDTPFDFGLSGAYRDAEIVISDGGATIEGRATDDRDEPVASFGVVVFSTERELWYANSRYTKVGQSRDGAFRITGLPPGQYFVAAVRRADPAASLGGAGLNDPDVFEPLSGRAQRVTLSERDRRTLNLRLSHR